MKKYLSWIVIFSYIFLSIVKNISYGGKMLSDVLVDKLAKVYIKTHAGEKFQKNKSRTL